MTGEGQAWSGAGGATRGTTVLAGVDQAGGALAPPEAFRDRNFLPALDSILLEPRGSLCYKPKEDLVDTLNRPA
jgi:hypothetical protein